MVLKIYIYIIHLIAKLLQNNTKKLAWHGDTLLFLQADATDDLLYSLYSLVVIIACIVSIQVYI